MNSFVKNNSLLICKKTEISSNVILWLEPRTNTIVTTSGTSNVEQWLDISGNDYHASQSVVADQPTYITTPYKRVAFGSSDKLFVTFPTTINGIMILGTTGGTAAYAVSIPAGTYIVGRHSNQYMPDNSIFGQIIIDSTASETDINTLISYVRNILNAGNNYETITAFSNYWRSWSEIIEFPLIDTSSATSLIGTWNGCSGLTSFPLLNTSNVTNFSLSWANCSKLLTFPSIDTSSGQNFTSTWGGCALLSSFPLLDFSSATTLENAWQNCGSLTSFPLIVIPNVVNLTRSWASCIGLISFPQIVTTNVTNFNQTWLGCTNLTNFPVLDTSNGTIFSQTWLNLREITSFPLLDIRKSTTFNQAWNGCSKLTNFPANFFNGCNAVNFTNAFSNTLLSSTSIDNILVSINSNGTSNGTFNQSGGSAPSAVGQAAITAMRSRGWTINVTGGF